MKFFIDGALKYIAIVTFVFSIFSYSFNLYMQNKRQSVEKIESYISEYAQGKVSEYDRIVSAFWKRPIFDQVRAPKTISSADADRVFFYLVKTDPNYEQYEEALNRILVHFDLVSFCVEQGLCEREIALGFYCSEYRTVFGPFKISRGYYRELGISVGLHADTFFEKNCHA